ncbi:hypothetical protein [Nostoc sp. DSM 114160]
MEIITTKLAPSANRRCLAIAALAKMAYLPINQLSDSSSLI